MRTPQRYPLRPVADAEPTSAADEDMRTSWQRHSKAVGIVIGSAISTLIVGTGGLTGLAHVAGIATTKELGALGEKLDGALNVHKSAETVNGGRFEKIEAALKELKLTVKPEPPPKKKRKPVSEE